MKYVFLFITIVSFTLVSLNSCNDQLKLSPNEARTIAKKAYIYGFPMVMGYKAMNAYVLDKNNPEYKGPFNTLSCDARLMTPEDKAVVTPNSDTPYCMMWADLRKEPVVISVPEMEPERFYHFQLVDLYTHNFDYIGTLSTGNKAGNYLIAPLGWDDNVPQGIDKVIISETPLFFVVVRTQLFGPGDIDNVKAIQDAYSVKTLGEYNGGPETPREESIAIPAWNEGDQFTTELFTYMDAMLDLIEPVDEEKELMKDFSRLHMGPGKTFDLSEFDEETQKAIKEGVADGLQQMEDFVKKGDNDPLATAKIFGTRDFLQKSAADNYQMEDFFLLRATAAHLGLYGNSGKEAIYPTYLLDHDGSPFDGSSSNYTITFTPDEFPPVNSFWSLTMYDGKTQLLVDNPLNRYLLNTTMMDDFVFGEDGSLTFYIQKDSPGKGKEANWLPAPDGPFYSVLRLYGPKESVLKGEWKNPPIVKAE